MKFNHCTAFSFGKGIKAVMDFFNKRSTPGPGSYSPSMNLSKKQNPQYKFGTSPREENKINENPGPGSYNISPIKESPSYSFYGNNSLFKKAFEEFKEARPLSATNSSPGPGHYNIRNNDITNIPSYKFGNEEKCKECLTSCTPGPKYDTRNQTGTLSPKYMFGTELKYPNNRPMTPGPGEYNIQNLTGKETPMYTFSKEERGLCPSLSSPINNYKIRKSSNLKSKSFVINNQNKSAKCFYSNMPGPGTYSPNDINTKYRFPTYRIGTAKRKDLYNVSINNPAPNKYYPNYLVKSSKLRSPTFKIGLAQRKMHYNKSCSPGPCTYNVNGNETCGPKYTLRIKYKLKDYNNVPGPGRYEYSKGGVINREPSWTIGKSERGEEMKRIVKNNYPGPGMYSVKVKGKNYGRVTIGKEKRKMSFKGKNSLPGPGQYRIPCEFDSVNEYTRQQGKFDENFKYV